MIVGSPGLFVRYKSRPQFSFQLLCLVCVMAMAFTGFVQVSHFHPDGSKLSGHECSICPIAHAGVLSSANYAPIPVFVRTFFVAVATHSPESSDLVFTLHIRPPPIAKA
jgi:hypothetical protein